MILIRPFIHLFSLSSILPFSHSICSVRPFVCPSVQLFSSFVHPFSPSIHLSIHFICPSICPVSPFVQFIQPCCLAVCLSVCQSVHQSVYSVGPSISLSVHQTKWLSVQSVCWYHRPPICPSILYIHSVCLVVHLFSLSICLSVYSDPAYQSICHFKGQFDPTDRNDRTSEIIMNKYSSQTDYPYLCSPSIHSVHPSSWKFNLSVDLSIQSIRPSDGRSDVFFLFGK